MAKRNGNDPANIFSTVRSLASGISARDDFTVNTEIPNGGVINPVSVAIIPIMPNQTKSYPKE